MKTVLEKKLIEMINIATNISIKYKQLKTMEQSNMKDESVYKSICIELANLHKEENEYYKNTKLNKNETIDLMKLLVSKNTFDPNNNIEDVIHAKTKFNPEQRVFYRLHDSVRYNEKDKYNIIDTIPNELKNKLSSNNIKNQIKGNLLFEENVLNNYYLILESFIIKYLETDPECREDLIHTKYLLSFLNTNVEKEFIDNNFDFKTNLYLNYPMIGDFYNMPRYVQEIKLNDIIFIIFAEESARLLDIKDNEIEKNKFDIILSKIILRSTTIFFSEEFLKTRQNKFDEFMKQNYLIFLNNQYAVKSITNIYNSAKKDKSNYQYLSLKPV